jgi:neuropeptide FF receptor 2
MYEKMYFIIGNLILCYALPLSLVIVSNGLIWLHVAKRKVPHESASPAQIKRVHRKTRHGVMKMLTVVTTTFLVSWLPLYVIFLVHKITGTLPEAMENMVPFSQWLGASNSSYNPILYAGINKKFRDAFLSLMACPASVPGRRENANTQATANSLSLNNSTVSIAPQGISFRQTRTTFRYPVVRV